MNPVLRFGERIQLPAWLLTLSLTASICFWWVNARAKRWGLSRESALDLALILAASLTVGGRLLHVFYEQPQYYLANPWALFFIWEGGFVFYGGLLLALVTGWLWCRYRREDPFRWGDFFAPVMAFAYGVGRIGCFLNGCCYGRGCDLPWAVTFHRHAQWGLPVFPRHPTQIYAAGWELMTMGLLLALERRPHRPGSIFFIWIGLHGIGRLIMEHFREDERGPMMMGLSLGTWLSFALIASSIGLLKGRSKV